MLPQPLSHNPLVNWTGATIRVQCTCGKLDRSFTSPELHNARKRAKNAYLDHVKSMGY